MMNARKILPVLAAIGLAIGLAGCDSSEPKAASAPVHKIPTASQMAKEKQVLIVERNMKAAKDYVAKVKAEKEAQAKAEAEAAAQTQAQSGSGLVANRSGTSGRNYQPKTRSNYRQGKARSSHNYKAHPRARRGGGGGDLSYDDIRRRSAELDRAERARNVPERDTSGVIVCVGGNC